MYITLGLAVFLIIVLLIWVTVFALVHPLEFLGPLQKKIQKTFPKYYRGISLRISYTIGIVLTCTVVFLSFILGGCFFTVVLGLWASPFVNLLKM